MSKEDFQVGDLVFFRHHTAPLGIVVDTSNFKAIGWEHGRTKVHWFKAGVTTWRHPLDLKRLEASHK